MPSNSLTPTEPPFQTVRGKKSSILHYLNKNSRKAFFLRTSVTNIGMFLISSLLKIMVKYSALG